MRESPRRSEVRTVRVLMNSRTSMFRNPAIFRISSSETRTGPSHLQQAPQRRQRKREKSIILSALFFLEFPKLFFEGFDAGDQAFHLARKGVTLEEFRIGLGGGSEDGDAGRDTALRRRGACNKTAVAERDVSVDSGLGGDDDAASDLRASRDAGLADQNRGFSENDIVSHLHEVVDFCAFLDPGFTESCAVDAGVRADLHVVVDLDDAVLRDFDQTAEGRSVSEAVRTDCGAGVDDDPVADLKRLVVSYTFLFSLCKR